MIKVSVKKQSNYPVSSVEIKRNLRKLLEKSGIVSDCEVSVALVSEKKMLDLSRQYLKDNKVHSVLSFTADEVNKKFVYPPDIIHLGEIIICFPKVFEEAKFEGKRMDEKVMELIEHGVNHLLGKHHG